MLQISSPLHNSLHNSLLLSTKHSCVNRNRFIYLIGPHKLIVTNMQYKICSECKIYYLKRFMRICRVNVKRLEFNY